MQMEQSRCRTSAVFRFPGSRFYQLNLDYATSIVQSVYSKMRTCSSKLLSIALFLLMVTSPGLVRTPTNRTLLFAKQLHLAVDWIWCGSASVRTRLCGRPTFA